MRSPLLLSMKVYLALVCGVSALFATESASDSVSDTSSDINSTAEHNRTTTRPQSAAWNPTHRPADVSATVETEEATITYSRDSSDRSPTNAEAATASSSGQRLLGTSTAVAAAGEAQTSRGTATTGAAREQSPPTLISRASSAASSATDTVPSPEPSSATGPEVASDLPSTDSPVDSTQTPAVIQNIDSTSASVTSTGNPTSKGAPYPPVTLREASAESTELSSASQPRSVTTFSTVVFSNTGGSKLLITTTEKTTTAPCEPTKSTASADVQPCSTRVVATHCLMVIASLAGLATIFMVSTIILCAKLTTRKHKVKKPQQATEMMSFSATLPEMNYSYMRQRNPVTNGVLVMHNCGDSDEDGGDNLTLISFLPENDLLV